MNTGLAFPLRLAALLCLAPLSALAADSPFDDAVAVWRFTDGAGLKAEGDVRTGLPLSGREKGASQARGGEGVVAQFNGGWFQADCAEALDSVFGYTFTLHVRLRVPDGQWDQPLLTQHGAGGRLAWSLHGVAFGRDPAKKTWEWVRQNYESYGDKDGRGCALEFELGVQPEPLYLEAQRIRNPNKPLAPDVQNGVFRIGVPVAMIGAGDWHDVTVRFTGPKLELYVDGVRVDEEWPIGKLRATSAACLIGARAGGQGTGGGFQGQMDHAAVWSRALSEAEIVQLSGGKAAVAAAEARILGPEKPGLQYWRPRGHNAWVGDVMPVFDGKSGRFHLFYLYSRSHHTRKWGAGGHEFAHLSSTDLVHWEHHPVAVPITRQCEELGTGTAVLLDDRIEVHFGLHTFRLLPKEATTDAKQKQILAATGRYEPFPYVHPGQQWPTCGVPAGQGVAVSTDGIHFQKQDINLTPAQNMWIYRDAESGLFHQLWADTLLTSSDLRNWKRAREHFLPLDRATAANNTGECPLYFEWNGWHYILMGRSGYWRARTGLGPYWEGNKGENRDTTVAPGVSPYDGLSVPMVAAFKNNRRLLVGNTWTFRASGTHYAGFLVFRELVQNPDGTLGLKWPEELIPPTGQPVRWQTAAAPNGGVRVSGHTVHLDSDAFVAAEVTGLPASYRFTATLVPGAGVQSFGLQLGETQKGGSRCELLLSPRAAHAQWGTPATNGPAAILPSEPASPRSPHWGRDFAVSGVTGLHEPFTLDVIVKYDPTTRTTLADACLNQQRTLITHRSSVKSECLQLFVAGGGVAFKDILIRPLKN